jgi:transcriptional regulator with XRE-family HTH domain
VCESPPFILHIQEFRKAKQLRQRDLAARSGLSYKRIWRLERNQCDPRLKSDLIPLSLALGVRVEDLYEIGPCAENDGPQEESA